MALARSVELPGIEPVAEIGVTCEDAESDDAKQRESTCGYARDVDAINRPQPQLIPQIEQRNAGPHPPARRRVPIPTVLSSLRMRSAVQFAASTNALDAIITLETIDSSPLAAACSSPDPLWAG